MIARRQLLSVGGLLGALTRAGEESPAFGAGQLSNQTGQDIVNALKEIGATVAATASFGAIVPVRLKQVDYLKAQGKFPDFIDVGADVWFAVHDWHVRLQQPAMLARDPTGRYTLMLGFTALVLRPDFVPNVIGTGYDAR